MHLAIVTYAGQPGGTPDDALLADALARLGASVAFAPWSDPEVRWAGFDAAVVRTTGDYHLNSDAWQRWLAILNPIRESFDAVVKPLIAEAYERLATARRRPELE